VSGGRILLRMMDDTDPSEISFRVVAGLTGPGKTMESGSSSFTFSLLSSAWKQSESTRITHELKCLRLALTCVIFLCRRGMARVELDCDCEIFGEICEVYTGTRHCWLVEEACTHAEFQPCFKSFGTLRRENSSLIPEQRQVFEGGIRQ
jgi:hypothetical protein